nr:delta(12) fatty acid desaturase DES8.11-like [Tanacetum cinerariifolium]
MNVVTMLLVNTNGLMIPLTLGFPLYLLTNISGKKYGRFANHFDPLSPIFSERERIQVVLSDIGILAIIYAIKLLVSAKGAAWVTCMYGVPVLGVHMFFVLITYLHHTHLSLPHYDSTEWNWIRGALSMIDRDFGFLNRVFHDVTHTHVLHHLISYIPHYHAKEARDAIKPVLGEFYKIDRTPIFKAMWREAKECINIEPDEDSEHKGTYCNLFKTLSDVEVSLLDASFSCKEIKDVVWDRGGNKTPGPEGFTFKFIKEFWDTIGTDFSNMVMRFELDVFIPRCCNSSFITLVPKIQDPVDVKYYRLISLIRCQYKVIAKVLANRIMKFIHSVVSEIQTAYIKGVELGHDKVGISHLQFTDDALVLGSWSLENAKNLCRILRCFQLSSGLKVNFLKSNLFGIDVTNVEVENLAFIFKLQPSSLPCTYLGLPLDANMKRGVHWCHIIEKFLKNLTSWKEKTLYYGGRLTLINSVLEALEALGLVHYKPQTLPSLPGGGVSTRKETHFGRRSKFPRIFAMEINQLCNISKRCTSSNGHSSYV